MRTLQGLDVIGALVASTAAVAAPSHLTDVQYMQAARCRALIASPALGKGDTTNIDALLKSEGASRLDFVYDKASEMQRDAARVARDASPQSKASLIAERDGPCVAFTGVRPTAMTKATAATSAN
jgi:hypothetical protein